MAGRAQSNETITLYSPPLSTKVVTNFLCKGGCSDLLIYDFYDLWFTRCTYIIVNLKL